MLFWKVLLVEVLFVEGQAFYSGLTHSLHRKRHSAWLPFVLYPCNTGAPWRAQDLFPTFQELDFKKFYIYETFFH